MPEEKQITILVVEDDDNLRSTLIDNLELEGFKILEASTIQAAKENIMKDHFANISSKNLTLNFYLGAKIYFSKTL